MLSCRDLVIRQGGKVLWQKLTFAISAGERVGIHAPSGTGKTTLGRVLAGWQKPTAGDVLLDGSPFPCISIVRCSLFPSILS